MEDPGVEEMKKLVAAWQADPVLFVWQVFGANPTEQQRAILNAIVKPDARVTVASGCGVGKTSVDAWLAIWHVALFPHSKAVATAPTRHQLQDCLVPEIGVWLGKAHPWFKDQLVCTSQKLFVKDAEDSQFCTFKTSSKNSPEALQGLHADYVLAIVDEASGVDDIVFEPLKGATGRKATRVVLTANPTRTTGYFFQSHHLLKDAWQCFHMSCLESPNVPESYIREIAKEYGEDSDMYRVRVLGEFPNASICQLIGRDVAEGAAGKHLTKDAYSFAPIIVGVDVAWEGNDRSCIVVRQGLATLAIKTFNQVDNMTLGGHVQAVEDEFNSDATFIDVGWGTGVIDFLRQLGRQPVPVNFGGKPISKEYKDKRTEIWCEMAKWFTGGGTIPKDRDLIEDLVGPQYTFLPNGQKKLEAKKEMKRRGLRSPDIADALALTFSAPVVKRGWNVSGQRVGAADGAVVFSDYDVLA